NPLPLVQALLVHAELEIRNALVQVQFEQHDPLPPQLINIKLQNQGDNHALIGQLVLGQQQAIELRALLHGLPGEEGFSSEFYFNSPDLDQRFWGQFFNDELPLPQRFQLGAELWGRWLADGQHTLQGAVRLPQLDWQQDIERLTVAEAALTFSVALDGLQQGELMVTEMQGKVDGVALPLQRFSGFKRGAQWSFSSDKLTLAPLWQIINHSTLVPESLKQRLAGLDPIGELQNPRFDWQAATETEPSNFNFSADLIQVGVSPWHGAPGLQGVDGLLQINRDGGRVDFTSDQFGLNFPQLYSQGWQFNQARGVVSWDIDQGRVRVSSQRLQLEGDKFEANGRFSLDLPPKSDQGAEGRLILMIGMERADAQLAPLFVPDKVVSEPLFNWLQQSIKGGRVSSGGLIYDMALLPKAASAAEISVTKPQPSVQMFFDVDQAALRYQSDWPQISQANPFVLIKGSELLVEVPRGRLLNTDLSSAQVYLPPQSKMLQIEGKLDGPAADIRTTLVEGPTREVLGEGLAPWQLDGVSQSQLALGVDLEHPEQSLIRIKSDLTDGLLSNASLGLDFSQLAGTLRYHERDGLSSGRLSGSVLGQPLQADIVTEQLSDGLHTFIRGAGWVGVEPLNQWLQQPILQHLQGSTEFQVKLDICGATADCSNLRIDSQLRGVTAMLPAPFSKTAEQSQPLGIDIRLGASPSMRLRYARQLDLALPLTGGFSGAELVLGYDQSPPVSRDDGLWVRGRLDQLVVEPWQHFITQTFFDQSGEQATEPSVSPVSAAAQRIKQVQLDIDRLSFGAAQLEQLQLLLTPDAEHWSLGVDSPMIRGQVELPVDQGAMVVTLDYLKLPDSADVAEEEAPDGPFDPEQDLLLQLDPKTLPAAQVRIASLSYGERDLGNWSFDLKPGPHGVMINGLKAKLGGLDVEAELDWSFQDQLHSSYIDLALTMTDLGTVMQEWGATPGMETESTQLSGQFSWQGSPLAFNWQTLDGESALQIKNGRVLDTNGSSQVVKIFSLFNSSTIWRRLSLDFSDLAKDGISFDRIEGKHRISDGVAINREPVTVTGPTFDLAFEGSLDLYNETIDQRMLVTLPITENLALAAVFLASPQIAGAVFLVEKLIGKELSKFTSVRYSIQGRWDDPQMELLKPEPQFENELIESDQ
ncbi:MAG: YhdP family protein, partial [Halopseudomonas sp.]